VLRVSGVFAFCFVLLSLLLSLGKAQAAPVADVGPDLSVVLYTGWPYVPLAAPGSLLVFATRVENLGAGNGQNVVITHTLPAFLTYEDSQNNLCDGPCPVTVDGQQVVWRMGNLPADTRYQYISLSARVSSSVSVGAVLTNVVEIGGASAEMDGEPNNEIDDPYANNRSVLAVEVIPPLPDLEIYNSIGAGVAAPGEKLRYSLFLVNQGGGTAEDVVLTDTLPLSVTYLAHASDFPIMDPALFTPTVNGRILVWHLGAVPRESWGYFTVDVLVDDQLAVGEILRNQSSVSTSSEELGRYTNEYTSEYPLVDNTPNLWVDKYSEGSRTPGNQFVYTIRIANNGGGSATGVLLTDTLPADLRFISAVSVSCLDPLNPALCQTNPFTASVQGQAVTWEIGLVPPGISNTEIQATVALSDDLAPGALITNVVQIQGNEIDSNPGDNIFVSVLPVVEAAEPDIALFKTVTSSPPRPGGAINYRLRVINQGAFRLENVVLTDTLPAGVSLRESFHTTCFAPPDCTENGFSPVFDQGQLVWQLGIIEVRGYGDFYLTVDVPLTVTAGNVLTNAAEISTDAAETDLSDNQSHVGVVVRGEPILAIQKSGPEIVLGNHPVTYTLMVSNSGDAQATALIITDALPADTGYVSGGTLVNGVVSWTLPVLGVGADVQLSLVVSAPETIRPDFIRNSQYGVVASGGFSAQGSAAVTTTVVWLSAANTSPTRIGQAIYFTASLSAPTPMIYTWAFGDGFLSAPDLTATSIYTYTQYGPFTAVVTATSGLGVLTATTPVRIDPHALYVPVVTQMEQE